MEECEHGAVRLVGGLTDSTGRLELCALGVWGKVCNAFGYWGPDTARVVCRQLGFSEDGELYYDKKLLLLNIHYELQSINWVNAVNHIVKTVKI